MNLRNIVIFLQENKYIIKSKIPYMQNKKIQFVLNHVNKILNSSINIDFHTGVITFGFTIKLESYYFNQYKNSVNGVSFNIPFTNKYLWFKHHGHVCFMTMQSNR